MNSKLDKVKLTETNYTSYELEELKTLPEFKLVNKYSSKTEAIANLNSSLNKRTKLMYKELVDICDSGSTQNSDLFVNLLNDKLKGKDISNKGLVRNQIVGQEIILQSLEKRTKARTPASQKKVSSRPAVDLVLNKLEAHGLVKAYR